MNNSSLCFIQTAETKNESYLCFSCENLPVCEVLDWIETSSNSTLVMDLSQVKIIHNNILVALVKAYQQAEALGKTLMLSSISPEFKIALEISQLDRLFPLLSA